MDSLNAVAFAVYYVKARLVTMAKSVTLKALCGHVANTTHETTTSHNKALEKTKFGSPSTICLNKIHTNVAYIATRMSL